MFYQIDRTPCLTLGTYSESQSIQPVTSQGHFGRAKMADNIIGRTERAVANVCGHRNQKKKIKQQQPTTLQLLKVSLKLY